MLLAALCMAMAAMAMPLRHRLLVWTAALVPLSPHLAVLAAVAAAGWRSWMTLRRRRANARQIEEEVPLLADLVGLGLSGGRPFPVAMAAAATHLHSPLAREVHGVLRQTAHLGAAAALVSAHGAAGRLYQVAGRALSTGASLTAAVHAFADEAHAERDAARLSALRRLPVVLMLPLALLILPGFVLLTVAPAVAGAVERIGL